MKIGDERIDYLELISWRNEQVGETYIWFYLAARAGSLQRARHGGSYGHDPSAPALGGAYSVRSALGDSAILAAFMVLEFSAGYALKQSSVQRYFGEFNAARLELRINSVVKCRPAAGISMEPSRVAYIPSENTSDPSAYSSAMCDMVWTRRASFPLAPATAKSDQKARERVSSPNSVAVTTPLSMRISSPTLTESPGKERHTQRSSLAWGRAAGSTFPPHAASNRRQCLEALDYC